MYVLIITILLLSLNMNYGFRNLLRVRNYSKTTKNSRMTLSLSNTNGNVKKVLALDFDGVLCASSPESSYSAIIAAKSHWPKECNSISDNEALQIRKAVMQLRPIVETGYENMLLVLICLRVLRKEGSINIKTLLNNWRNTAIKQDLLNEIDESSENLIKVFGKCRDNFIKDDFKKWISLNEIFTEVNASLINYCTDKKTGKCKDNVCIITTKQGRFVQAILNENSLPCPASDRLYDLDNPYGKKPEVLKALLNEAPESEIHFVEDRMETLLSVAKHIELSNVRLYLVAWGYNTEHERAQAQTHPRITLLKSAIEFENSLKNIFN